ncbi:hypothetical protein AAAC51_39515 [Priestia megaterium]
MEKIKHVFSPDHYQEPHKDKAKVEQRLINLGVPLTEAGPYADDLQKGKVLLLVNANRETKTNSFLEKRGILLLPKVTLFMINHYMENIVNMNTAFQRIQKNILS